MIAGHIAFLPDLGVFGYSTLAPVASLSCPSILAGAHPTARLTLMPSLATTTVAVAAMDCLASVAGGRAAAVSHLDLVTEGQA